MSEETPKGFKEKLESYRIIVDKQLTPFLDKYVHFAKPSDSRKNYTYISEQIMLGGKRLRPALMIAVYELLTAKTSEEAYKASIALELLHNYTLMHDDIMDEDSKRRGKVNMVGTFQNSFSKVNSTDYRGLLFNSLQSRHTVSQTILVGNLTRGMSIDALINTNFDDTLKFEALKVLNAADVRVNIGQVSDLYQELRSLEKMTEPAYIEMVTLKTGNLFGVAAEIGGILANVSNGRLELLRDYGLNMGIAFQLQDDMMDLTNNDAKGNTYGSDIRKGKHTLIAIKTRERAKPSERKILDSIIGKSDASTEEIDQVISIMTKHCAIRYAREVASKYVQAAKSKLHQVTYPSKGFCEERMQFLEEFTEFMTLRLK
jgi:geranylgeranyl diphosphate synthase type I